MAKPIGSLNKRTQAQIAKAGSTGEMPLDALLKGMRYHLKRFDALPTIETVEDHLTQGAETLLKMKNEALSAALAFAKEAAPYIHARLANVQVHADHTVNYVARVPETATTAEQWENKHKIPLQ